MNTSQIFTGGAIAERLMRDRGRTRGLVAAWNLKRLKERLRRFDSGEWRPVAGRMTSTYSISLTSWSKRINDLQLTLLTLIDQDVEPSAIHVWLTPDDLALLPQDRRRRFETYGVQFKPCPDYRSHKKWLPLALEGHQDPVVLCDDDIFYPREWFGRLVSEDREDAFVGCKCHRILLRSDGKVAPYSEWKKQITHHPEPSSYHFATCCGGEILHPSRLDERSLDWEVIRVSAFNSDDQWLNCAHLAGGYPVYKTAYSFPCLELPGTNDTGLLANHNIKGNDEQIKATWAYFQITSAHFNRP